VEGRPVTEGDQGTQARLGEGRAADVRTIAKGGAVQIVGQISQRSLSFFFGLVAFRFVGASGYGLYRKVNQLLLIASQLGLAGFNYAAMRFMSRARARAEPGGVRGALRVSLAGTSIASAVVFVMVVVLAEQLGETFAGARGTPAEVAMLLRLGAVYVPLYALLQTLRYATQSYKTMVPSVVAGNIVQPVLRFLIGVAVLVAGFEVAGMVVTLWVSVALSLVLIAYYLRRMMTEDELAAEPRAERAEMTRFALLQAGSSLLGIQTLGLNIIILGLYASDREVGLLAAALSLQGPGTVFLGGIVNIWAPVVTDLHERGAIGRLDSLYKTINRWIATFSFPVFAALILEPDLFAHVFTGSATDAADAAPLVAVLALGNLFYTGTGPTGYVLSMTGHPGVNLINSIASVTLYVVAGLWAAPRYGALGVAWVDAGVTALVNSARVIEAKLLVGVQPFGRTFFKPVAATLVGAGVLLAWRLVPGDSMPLEIAGVAVAALVYLAVLKALGLDPEERHVFERIKQRALKRR
jgi:O-antigen/teichoic acid export membrane protein